MGLLKKVLDPRNSLGAKALKAAKSSGDAVSGATKADAIARIADVYLTPSEIVSRKGDGGPVAGAVARLETTGDIQQRITATRMAVAGPFAFAMKKASDTRKLYLTIEGVGWSLVRELPVSKQNAIDPGWHDRKARDFVAAVNATAQAARATPTESQGAVSPLEQIAKLAELRDAGAITPEEFEAKKADLLGRI